MHRIKQNRASAGIALVAVLWLVTLLSVLALGVLDSARRHGQLAKRSFESLQAQELADSAIRLAILELSSPARVPADARLGSFVQAVDVFGRTINVTAENENTRIDLNYAERDLFFALFAANGIPETEAQELADQIVDWRDTDDDPTAHGAERPEYQRAGRAVRPRNGPFETVTELRLILSAQLIPDRILDAFTVYSHSRTAADSRADSLVGRALRWAGARRLGGQGWINGQAFQESAIAPDVQSPAGKAIRLRACVDAAGTNICRCAVVRFTGNLREPVQLLAWGTAYELETVPDS